MTNFKYISLSIFIIILAYELRTYATTEYFYPELTYTAKQFIESLNYSFGYHTAVTSDGYLLELHRISSRNTKPGAMPVFIMHGLIGSSLTWLVSGEKSLPLHLASKGYDVWLGNARGNTYSRKHRDINPDTNPEKFFDFSWHEIGAIDLPTMIDYVLNKTQQKKLFYVGHSQGCISFYVMMSEKPEYNKKIEVMFAYAPVVYTKGIQSVGFRGPAHLQGFLEWLYPKIGLYEILPRSDIWTNVANVYCRDGALLQPYCDIPIGLSGGFNKPGLNSTLLPLIYKHVPSGSAVRQLLHYIQILNSDIFQQYDFGSEENIRRYGQSTPPLYQLANTKVPVAIFWAKNDLLTNTRNIQKLHSELPNVILEHEVEDELFDHFDFHISFTAEYLLYPETVRFMERYMNKEGKMDI